MQSFESDLELNVLTRYSELLNTMIDSFYNSIQL